MARRASGRAARPVRRLAAFLFLGALAVGAGFLAAYLARDLPFGSREVPGVRREPSAGAQRSRPETPPRPEAPEPLDMIRGAPGGSRLAVVIDDLGRDLGLARAFLDLEIPITPAILPHLAHSLEVAHLAREREREFLLHLPMEPQGYPKVDPGRGALLRGMHEGQVRMGVAEGLSAVPGAAGVNNHMGSRLTSLAEPMAWVMDELRERGLYFLDSVTSPRSVAVEAARAAGVPWARRDVFLDNEQSVEAVGRQIALAADRARRSGSAIAIGHPHGSTLEALRLWAPKLAAEGVEVVPLGALLQRPAG